ncbi:dipeptidyl aminopeptidase/acylaminoacyl peptidase [Saccharothrix tamanrassetensis]|uniref:Dipeptidyl aminopeptidase/acylaminoacyl peptidase n=1 Tax=Saccharothrix tamanrassetensis TaxID=1051531 RepID=A0A841CBU5_9PSEU|nr:prolyl oligopeptidase family serine peptidase [Saccharothrix tamanrassetensis]MBB5953475.1 dipeptidyl aminopeptidase/acylaminoacyl peptidase [Saccharothrix tamanrassetensis]
MVKIAPYGTWTSPIGAADAAAAGGGLHWVDLHRGRVWWAEGRPAEGGRVALVRDGRDLLPPPWNVRNRVHEYGGRPWVVLDTPDGERVAFTDWDDQRIYLFDPDDPHPVPISPEPERHHGLRYADLTAGPGGTEVWCVRETVTGDARTDVRRELVAVPLDGSAPRVLAASHHFMTGPRLSPDGAHFAWIGWDHPDMPWDGSELCVAAVGSADHRVLAGGPREAVCQVEWETPDADADDPAPALLALTDPDGWWNLYRIGLDGTSRNLAPCREELGGPMWRLGNRWFAAIRPGRYLVLRSGALAVLDERSGTVTDVDNDLPVWLSQLAVHDGVVVGGAAGPRDEAAVVTLDLSTGELTRLTDHPASLPPADYLPVPEERVFTGPDGQDVPAYVYPPTNPDFTGPDDELPPYVVHVHGGPTGRSVPVLDVDIAYFTSRGIGVVSVNYGGSTGYGRAFRERLREQWGVVDVNDCAAVAQALADEGTADGARLGIRGGSAGGWTSAASMTSVKTYRCGMVAFPILDLRGWTGEGGETHDFESRYVEGLVGPWPQTADRYAERSPSGRVERLAGPVLLLQGLEDEICPPEQADRFVAALDGTGIPHAYLTFEGEQHGFRKAGTIIAALEAELSFYGQVFGFVPDGVPVLELRR